MKPKPATQPADRQPAGRRPPIGRRPGSPDTRESILAAARDQFGSVGFDRATIRGVAETAAVDPALVIHYFANKRRLFVEAHELPMDPSEVFASVAELPMAERGEALTRLYLEVFTQPGSPALSMLRAASTNEDAATMLRQFINRALVDHGPSLVAGPDPELRAALLASHLVGVLFGRELLGITQLAETSIEALTATIGPVVQHYIDP